MNTGNDLYAACKVDKFGLCAGYIMGIIDAVILGQTINGCKKKERCFCLPLRSGVTKEQTIDVVIKDLESNPESRDQAASLIVYFAIRDFTCK